ncbi:hypothetical protein BDV09DRAFT_173024 [Aspergillus tetrazonus]
MTSTCGTLTFTLGVCLVRGKDILDTFWMRYFWLCNHPFHTFLYCIIYSLSPVQLSLAEIALRKSQRVWKHEG